MYTDKNVKTLSISNILVNKSYDTQVYHRIWLMGKTIKLSKEIQSFAIQMHMI